MSTSHPRRRAPRRRFTFPQIAFFAILGCVIILTLSLAGKSDDLAILLERVLPFLGGLGLGTYVRSDR